MPYAHIGIFLTFFGYTSGFVTLIGHLRAGWPIELLVVAIILFLSGLLMMICGKEVHRPTIIRYTCNYCGRYGKKEGNVCPHCLHGWIVEDPRRK